VAEAKTKPTEASVESYVAAIESAERRSDCESLIALMSRVTGELPRMWGASIVGFGSYRYRYDSGREGESCLTGFSSRKGDISIYTQVGFEGLESQLRVLGKHKVGKSCLYVRRMAEVEKSVLENILKATVERLKNRYP
jgi:hypothetical protein